MQLETSAKTESERVISPELGDATLLTKPDESGDPNSPANNSFATTETIQQLENILNECKLLGSLIERKPASTPGLMSSAISSYPQRYSPLEVSELLNTQNKDAPLKTEKPLSPSLLNDPQLLQVPRKPIRPPIILPPPQLSTPSPW